MRSLAFLFCLVIATTLVSGRPVASHDAASTRETIPARLDAYAKRLAELKRAAVESGRVSYAQVVAASYPAGVLTPDAIMRKRRLYHEEEPVLFTDYSRIHVSVPFTEKAYIAGRAPGSRLWGQYNFGSDRMYVDQAAHASVIIHEAGHVLQRKELINRRRNGESVLDDTDAERVEEAAKQGVISASRSARIRYLVRQDEMDVRLQDLNRFFANVVSDRPILSHQDALDALYALGAAPTVAEVRTACELAGIRDAEPHGIPRMIVDARIDTLFDDAAELRELCYWSKRAGGELWPDILARILKQAPHHF
ncbi:MAG: hypothetical protein ACREIA_00380 [Opitutaceae bacterium]